jgi:hypothetical protein
MVQRLEAIPNLKISITCGGCQHTVVHEVANLLLVVDGKTTTHEVRTRATCPKCLVVGNNTYKVT